MKFSENIKNLFIFSSILVLSIIFVFFLGQTNFADQIELITFTPYSQKKFLLTFFTLGLLGNYISIYKLWKNPNSVSNSFFAISYGLLLLIASIFILHWISDMDKLLHNTFESLKFPNDVDEVIYKLRASFLRTIFWIFFSLGLIGLISFLGILFLQKRLFKGIF